MAFLLDTNACIDYLTGRYPRVVARIQDSSPEDLFLSVVVVAELRYGADHSARRRTNHSRIDALVEEIEPLDFDLRAAATYGRVRAQLEKGGTPIGAPPSGVSPRSPEPQPSGGRAAALAADLSPAYFARVILPCVSSASRTLASVSAVVSGYLSMIVWSALTASSTLPALLYARAADKRYWAFK